MSSMAKKTTPQGGRPSSSQSVQVAQPEAPHEACFKLCQEDPWGCMDHCKAMGMSENNCRNPVNAKRSQMLHHDVDFSFRADKNGTGSLRFSPFLHKLVEVYSADATSGPTGTRAEVTGFYNDTDGTLTAFGNGTGSHPAFGLYGSTYSAYRFASLGVTIHPEMATMIDQGQIVAGVELADTFDNTSTTIMEMPGAVIAPAKEGVSVAMAAGGSAVETYFPTTNAAETPTPIQRWVTTAIEYSPDDWFNVNFDPDYLAGYSGSWGGSSFGPVEFWDASDRLIFNFEGCAPNATFAGKLTLNFEGAPHNEYVEAQEAHGQVGAHIGTAAIPVARAVGAANFARRMVDSSHPSSSISSDGRVTGPASSAIVKKSLDVAKSAGAKVAGYAGSALKTGASALAMYGLESLAGALLV